MRDSRFVPLGQDDRRERLSSDKRREEHIHKAKYDREQKPARHILFSV